MRLPHTWVYSAEGAWDAHPVQHPFRCVGCDVVRAGDSSLPQAGLGARQLIFSSFHGPSRNGQGSGDLVGMQALGTQEKRGPVFPLVIPIKPPPGKLPAPGEGNAIGEGSE
eukprot:CAMPEP_0178461212 /NCGR_PEP_ID=MMETSP0689_2-20121128/49174_1 /TAXON_ID=160604 /ORGANISM="Amphidinium massartii, Strain CS-259" /LENGTH=110 /DNA_ID=CAMNT_0020088003 /DNA_START=48 /DNA_END=377 /DNA_ORIENTATION=-